MRNCRLSIFYFGLILPCALFLVICPVAESDSSVRGAFSFTGFSMGVGTRAMGMNGAFAAVSDDSSSAYWNPAGLAAVWYKELSFTRADLYALDLITNSSLNISAPDTGKGALSLGWNRLQYDLESWLEEAFLASYARTIYRHETGTQVSGLKSQVSGLNISCGVALKYLRQTSDLKLGASVCSESAAPAYAGAEAPVFCKARGLGLDAGFLARLPARDGRNRLSIGIAAQDIPTFVQWNYSSEVKTEEYLPYRYAVGFSAEPLPRLTVALDMVGEQKASPPRTRGLRFVKELHFGVEHWFLPVKTCGSATSQDGLHERNLAIRGGIAKQFGETSTGRMTFAGGIGIRWSTWQLDYAYLMDNNGLGDTRNRFSVSVRF